MFSFIENQDFFLSLLFIYWPSWAPPRWGRLASISLKAIWSLKTELLSGWAHKCLQLSVSRHDMSRHLCNLGTNLETPVRNVTEIISRFELMVALLWCFLKHLKVHLCICTSFIPTHHMLHFGATLSDFEHCDTSFGFLSWEYLVSHWLLCVQVLLVF